MEKAAIGADIMDRLSATSSRHGWAGSADGALREALCLNGVVV
jgi:hypothetical protein